MHRFLALLVYILLTNPIQAQNSFSFNCVRDTTVSCDVQCITLKATIPDIYSSTTDYTVNKITNTTCFRPLVDPAGKGKSTQLNIDDRYSPILDISFPFSFYGSSYNKLIASTNGFLSFDTSNKLTFSHFGILNNGGSLSSTVGIPEDLPSSLYDKAVIMGAYQDLNPTNSGSFQQIKYEVIGVAPYRKWILTHYNIPLYTTACLNLNTNTQQIVLYETLGIVEVYIMDKEICNNWNNGRTMIGMQDFTKTKAIMAPERMASSEPWGTMSMNESWRFVPSAGQRLFKKVELHSLSGTYLATGATTVTANNLIDITFDNICPPGSGGTYLIKSFYKDPANAFNDIISVDTVRISRGDPITTNITAPGCAPGSTGEITVLTPSGSTYEYSINGINWQASNNFKLPAGTYTINARIIGNSCISTKTIVLSADQFNASVQTKLTPCPGPVTGSIEVTPVKGTSPFLYSLNGGAFQSSNKFFDLMPGTYSITVKDNAGCTFSTDVNISASNMASTKVTNTICGDKGTGSITVSPGFGTAPYTYTLNGGASQTSNVFDGLVAGKYSITIKDATSCSHTLDAEVKGLAVLSTSIESKMPSCFGNNNGKLIVHAYDGNAPYKFALDNGPFQSDSVFDNLRGGNYMLHIVDTLGCIRDTVIKLNEPALFRITAITTQASTCTSPDGEIFIKANGGTTPYQYSVDSGKTFFPHHIFKVVANQYKILVKDANGCETNDTATVGALDRALKVNIGADKNLCSGSSVILTSNVSPTATTYSWSPGETLSDSAAKNPIATPIDTTIYILNAKTVVCEGSDTIRINVLHKPIVDAGRDTTICYNSSARLKGSVTNISGPVKYLWSPSNDITNPTSVSTNVYPKNATINSYILQVTDSYGCNFKVFDKVNVTMNPPMQVSAGNDTVTTVGLPHQLSGSGGTQYLWSPGSLLNNPMIQNPVAILSEDTKFNLTVKDSLGCVGKTSVTVKVFKGTDYYLPNAFTPNGDGLNDVFKATAPGIQATKYFRIFNRWGKLMYESKDVRKGWDGNFAGVPQPTDVYIWMIKGLDTSEKPIELKGTVTLIR